jgi:hypothetical protein
MVTIFTIKNPICINSKCKKRLKVAFLLLWPYGLMAFQRDIDNTYEFQHYNCHLYYIIS